MTRSDEYAFLRNLSSAMRHSGSARALEALWRDYEDQIAQCSREGQAELRRLRSGRERELMSKGAA